RGPYYDSLTRVRESNDINQWIRFFLQAVAETAEKGKDTLQRLLVLRHEVDNEVIKLGRRAENAQKLLAHLYKNPAITISEAMELLGLKYTPANQLIISLIDCGILQEITGQQRNRTFVFGSYLNVFRG
ncbi:MAG: Fic family protein, partial [Armatimonadota bacterium]